MIVVAPVFGTDVSSIGKGSRLTADEPVFRFTQEAVDSRGMTDL